MGKSLALQAAKKYLTLPKLLGNKIKSNGNHCYYFNEFKLITFPTKHNWREKSDYDLIFKSMTELYNICYLHDIHKIIMPKVGCNNGKLEWSKVKSKILDILNASTIKFIVVDL